MIPNWIFNNEQCWCQNNQALKWNWLAGLHCGNMVISEPWNQWSQRPTAKGSQDSQCRGTWLAGKQDLCNPKWHIGSIQYWVLSLSLSSLSNLFKQGFVVSSNLRKAWQLLCETGHRSIHELIQEWISHPNVILQIPECYGQCITSTSKLTLGFGHQFIVLLKHIAVLHSTKLKGCCCCLKKCESFMNSIQFHDPTPFYRLESTEEVYRKRSCVLSMFCLYFPFPLFQPVAAVLHTKPSLHSYNCTCIWDCSVIV